MKEELFIHKDTHEYYIYEFFKNPEANIHLVYNIKDEEFYFEQYLSSNGQFFEQNAVLMDYSTCSEEELFMQSTLYDYTHYCTIERLAVVQKAILEVYSTDPNKDVENMGTFKVNIDYEIS